jgi:hypothetical protein
MIGRRMLPNSYEAWNVYWGAPFGYKKCREMPIRQRPQSSDPSRYGVFGFQGIIRHESWSTLGLISLDKPASACE